jgi:DNA-binding protein YbaB
VPDTMGTPKPIPLDQARDRIARLAQVRERLTQLVGRAESADGLIKVAATADDPLHDVQLDPRALKLLNTDLAAALQQTAAAARADLKRQLDDLLATALSPGDPARMLADPTAATASLREMTATMNTAAQDTAAALERLRAHLRG